MSYNDVLALVLGGGAGSRLYPLTKLRAKPAVPIGGKYRLVDIPISNCLNSGVNRIYVLTQYNSVSLHRHIASTYPFDLFSKGWVHILAAEQTAHSCDWYQGSADALRKQMTELRAAGPKDYLILAGDQLCRMPYEPFIEAHRSSGADITVSVIPVSSEDARRFGIVQVDESMRIVSFHEKPSGDELVRLAAFPGEEKPFLASMGVYLFKAGSLERILATTEGSDFGKHVIPQNLHQSRVMAYPFRGYWEDIGTIRSFYETSLLLATPAPPFDFYDTERPIYTMPTFLPASHLIGSCDVRSSLVADGCRISSSVIEDSVIGIRSVIGPKARISRSVVMGADFYEFEGMTGRAGLPPVGIGEGSVVEGAIVDKNARIGKRVVIRHQPGRPDSETGDWAVRDGLVIVLKDGVVGDGTII